MIQKHLLNTMKKFKAIVKLYAHRTAMPAWDPSTNLNLGYNNEIILNKSTYSVSIKPA